MQERGNTLSTGQKQLVSFARALAHNPRILILDEATSSVDTDTEFRVREALTRLVEGRTSLIIAHRLSTIQRADKIIVMHKGKVREMGTHQQLLAPAGHLLEALSAAVQGSGTGSRRRTRRSPDFARVAGRLSGARSIAYPSPSFCGDKVDPLLSFLPLLTLLHASLANLSARA